MNALAEIMTLLWSKGLLADPSIDGYVRETLTSALLRVRLKARQPS